MPLFRALAKNIGPPAISVKSALRFCNGSYTSVCLYSVTTYRTNHHHRVSEEDENNSA
jgi:hypothetical protein